MWITSWDVTLHRSSLSQWLSSGGAYWGCGLKATCLYLLLLSEMPRPEASMPLPVHLLLCHPLHDYHYPWDEERIPLWLRRIPGAEPGRHPRPVNAQGRSTPEAIDLKETLSYLAVLLVDSSLGVPPC